MICGVSMSTFCCAAHVYTFIQTQQYQHYIQTDMMQQYVGDVSVSRDTAVQISCLRRTVGSV